MSKAWRYECFDPDDGIMVFFADTRNQAKQIALGWDAQYRRYIDIRVERLPTLDQLNHESGYEMDWGKESDRIEMLKLGLHCFYSEESPMDCCKYCINAEDCVPYHKWIKEVNKG